MFDALVMFDAYSGISLCLWHTGVSFWSVRQYCCRFRRDREGINYHHRTIFPAPLASLGIPVAALWHHRDTPGSASIFASPAEAAQRTPGPSFWSSRLHAVHVFTFRPGPFSYHFRPHLGPQSRSFGTHNHPPGPSFGTPSPPLHPLASYWGPFDTLLGSGESLPGPSWDPLGYLRTTPGIPRLHLGPSGCPSWQPLVFLFGTGAGGRGGACK